MRKMKSKKLIAVCAAVLAAMTVMSMGAASKEEAAGTVTQVQMDYAAVENVVPVEKLELTAGEGQLHPAAQLTAPVANLYRSELTNEWIDASLVMQRPVAIMVDNESKALPHYGLTEADVVYEMMNSTANGRITRLMAIVKDWDKITRFGSIRSTRPTNIMLAAEWNAVLCHDGGPFYINDWIARDYSANLSGGFSRIKNGKPRELRRSLRRTGRCRKCPKSARRQER